MKFDYFFNLTDNIGVLQHAKFSIPARREGYTVDDNARALVLVTRALTRWPDGRLSDLQRRLLAFLLLMQSENGQLHNLMDFSQRIMDQPSVGDHLGRTLWAMGAVINSKVPTGMKKSARLIFDRALPWIEKSTPPRTKAYGCLGLAERLMAEPNETNLTSNLQNMAASLVESYAGSSTPGWEWFESILSYDNARLSQALFAAHKLLGDAELLDCAERSLTFLMKTTTVNDMFVPIGSNGWFVKKGNRAVYDQQPIEAGTMIETTITALNSVKSAAYERALRRAIGWFFGLNTKSAQVYDVASGACYDAITPVGVNENQGAESTISFLLAAATFVGKFASLK